jgi:hypothetical protein
VNMTVWTEVWPVTVDEFGLWLVSGEDALRSDGPVMSDTGPRGQVRTELLPRLDVPAADLPRVLLALASTADTRIEERGLIITFVAFLRSDGPVRDRWPNARPITADSPALLLDTLRQVRDLGDAELDQDGIERPVVLDESWRPHLYAL